MVNAEAQSKMAAWGLPPWFLKVYSALVIGVFFLIALGGSVRIMKAGLACPDWPLCFGNVIPDFHPQVYFEFIHRVVAGSVALCVAVLHFFIFRSRAPEVVKAMAGLAIVLLLGQIVFGGLTVLLLLQSYVVATHLMLGTGFFLTLLWTYLLLKPAPTTQAQGPSWLFLGSLFLFIAIYGQILLGGLVASNFASLSCTGWPQCNGAWFPTFRGPIGLHIIHRLGAYTIFVLTLTNMLVMRKHAPSPQVKRLSKLLFHGVMGQLILGVSNVLFFTPPILAVAHLALGVGLLSIALRQLFAVRALRPSAIGVTFAPGGVATS